MPFVFNAAFMENLLNTNDKMPFIIDCQKKNEEILKNGFKKLNIIAKPGWIIFYVRMECFENQRFTEK